MLNIDVLFLSKWDFYFLKEEAKRSLVFDLELGGFAAGKVFSNSFYVRKVIPTYEKTEFKNEEYSIEFERVIKAMKKFLRDYPNYTCGSYHTHICKGKKEFKNDSLSEQDLNVLDFGDVEIVPKAAKVKTKKGYRKISDVNAYQIRKDNGSKFGFPLTVKVYS